MFQLPAHSLTVSIIIIIIIINERHSNIIVNRSTSRLHQQQNCWESENESRSSSVVKQTVSAVRTREQFSFQAATSRLSINSFVHDTAAHLLKYADVIGRRRVTWRAI